MTSNTNNISETIFDAKSNKHVIRCLLCNKNCDTMIQLDVHNNSKAHINKLQSKVSEKSNSFPTNMSSLENCKSANSGLYFCKICNISCNTEQQLEKHYTGKVHIKKSLTNKYKSFNSSDSSNQEDICLPETELENEKVQVINETRKEISEVIKNESIVPEAFKDLLIPDRRPNWITCKLCKLDTNTEEQYQVHCNSNKHIKKLKSFNIPIGLVSNNELKNNDFVKCEICNITFHKNNENLHNTGKLHKEKLIKCTIYEITEQRIKKDTFSSTISNLEILKLKPRGYQQEIYEKAIMTDCVIFLPTGTGKTLIGAMLMLKMLEENPYHRVAFLVDKVLLVMQQNDFLKEQFHNVVLDRFTSQNQLETRKLRTIGLAGEYINTKHACALRDHDIIVATANLFQNSLKSKHFYWRDFSLIILDEAHHCVKEHPYKKLLYNYHLYPNHVLLEDSQISTNESKGEPLVDETLLKEWKLKRCKLIGLTASPAGDLNADSTLVLLETLLKSLGDVKIVNVTEHVNELKKYTSLVNTRTEIISYDDKEKNLRHLVVNGFIFLLKKYERLVQGIANDIVLDEMNSLSIKTVGNLRNQICDISKGIQENHTTVLKHMLSMVEIIQSIDSIGYKAGYKQFKDIVEDQNDSVWFNNNIFCFEEKSKDIINADSDIELKSSSIVEWIKRACDSIESHNRTILILVKERKVASELTGILQEECSAYEIEMLIGHGNKGTGTNTPGMTINKQKKALDFIRERKTQIIVATSVAEEGIDLPHCDLVIIITPPSSVQALIQIRGRARKKQSKLIILCRDQQSVDSLEELKTKENNIQLAIQKYLEKEELDDAETGIMTILP